MKSENFEKKLKIIKLKSLKKKSEKLNHTISLFNSNKSHHLQQRHYLKIKKQNRQGGERLHPECRPSP